MVRCVRRATAEADAPLVDPRPRSDRVRFVPERDSSLVAPEFTGHDDWGFTADRRSGTPGSGERPVVVAPVDAANGALFVPAVRITPVGAATLDNARRTSGR